MKIRKLILSLSPPTSFDAVAPKITMIKVFEAFKVEVAKAKVAMVEVVRRRER